MPSHIHILIAAIVIISGMLALLVIGSKAAKSVQRKPLLTPSARSFFGQLDMAVSTHLIILPSIPVTSVISAKYFTWSHHLLSKLAADTFDFLLCDRKNMDFICTISLREPKEQQTKKMITLKKLCAAIDLPFLEYDHKPYRDVPTLRKQIFASCNIDTNIS